MDGWESSASSSSETTSWQESDSLSDVDSAVRQPTSHKRSHADTGFRQHSREGRSSKQQVLARLLQALMNNRGRRRDNNRILDLKTPEQLQGAGAQAADSAVELAALHYARQINDELQAATDSYHSHRLKALRNRLSSVRTRKATQLLHHKHAAAAPHSKTASSGHQTTVHYRKQQTQQAAAAGVPSLPALAVIAKLLLQLVAAKTSAAVVTQLRLQFLQQIKAAAAAAKHQQNPVTVAAAVYAALPGLRAAVKQICRATEQSQQLQISVTAESPCEEELQDQLGLLSAAMAQDYQRAVPAAPMGNAVLDPACAVEAALVTAACEVQLGALHISSDTMMQQPAIQESQCSNNVNCSSSMGHDCSSRQPGNGIDMESLLLAELSRVTPEAGNVICG